LVVSVAEGANSLSFVVVGVTLVAGSGRVWDAAGFDVGSDGETDIGVEVGADVVAAGREVDVGSGAVIGTVGTETDGADAGDVGADIGAEEGFGIDSDRVPPAKAGRLNKLPTVEIATIWVVCFIEPANVRIFMCTSVRFVKFLLRLLTIVKQGISQKIDLNQQLRIEDRREMRGMGSGKDGECERRRGKGERQKAGGQRDRKSGERRKGQMEKVGKMQIQNPKSKILIPIFFPPLPAPCPPASFLLTPDFLQSKFTASGLVASPYWLVGLVKQ
jgi:hypothetical protein